jgi:putative glutamine amidotransferase
MMKPLIAITCSRVVGGAWSSCSPGHFMDYTYDEYSRAVSHYGGAPVLLPVAQDGETLATILQHIDGLILSGGPDIHPRHYGESPRANLGEIDEELDRMELAVALQAHRKGLPILAICRGIQTLNVCLGGTLYQDIPSQIEGAINHYQKADKSINTHSVKIASGSCLAGIFKRKTVWVNGKHHQAVKETAPGLIVSAAAEDGVVEAVEDPARKFVVGVQWHPEGTWKVDRNSGKLFRAFLKAARTSVHP